MYLYLLYFAVMSNNFYSEFYINLFTSYECTSKGDREDRFGANLNFQVNFNAWKYVIHSEAFIDMTFWLSSVLALDCPPIYTEFSKQLDVYFTEYLLLLSGFIGITCIYFVPFEISFFTSRKKCYHSWIVPYEWIYFLFSPTMFFHNDYQYLFLTYLIFKQSIP